MKIFLTGAQGVGKSTLATSIETDLEIKDSFSKRFLEKSPDIQTSEHIDYDKFQDKILLYCLSQYVNDNDFISSRSIIDSYAYLSACKSKNEVFLKNILNHYKEYLLTENDIYIYLPIEFEISKSNNKMRDTSLEYQLRVDEQIHNYFKQFKELSKRASFYTIQGTREERLEKLKNIIKLHSDV